jgi:hypothetical protein
MPFDPDAYLAKKTGGQQQAGFDPDAYLSKKMQVQPDAISISQEIAPESVSAGDSFIQNFSRGATFGMGDEIGGHIEALGSKIGLRGLGSPYLRDVRLETDEEDAQPYDQVQEEMRDRRRGLLKQGEKENPVSSFLGNVAGGIATVPAGGALLKGASTLPAIGKAAQAGANMLTSGSKVAQLAKTGAVEGGLYGFGESEGETAKDVLFDTAKGATLGGVISPVLGKGMEGAGKAVKFVGDNFSKLTPSKTGVEIAANLLADLPPNYTEQLLKNPNLANVRGADDLADSLIDVVRNNDSQIFELSKKANSFLPATLNTNNSVKSMADDVANILNNKNILQSKTANNIQAVNSAEQILQTLEAYSKNGLVSDRDLKKVLQDARDMVDYDNPAYNKANDALESIADYFDEKLKNSYPNYREAMKPVAERMQQKNKMLKLFGLKKGGEKGYEAQDRTYSFLKQAYDPQGVGKKPVSMNAFESQNPELAEEIMLRQIIDKTEGGVTQGSRNVLSGATTGAATIAPLGATIGGMVAGVPGAAVGGLLGGFAGGAVGAGAGLVKDKFGRKIGKEFIDANRDKILNRDLLFQKLGERVGRGADKAQQAIPAVTRGINAAAIPAFVANELKKDPAKFDENEKRTVTKIWLLKQKNPNLTEDEIKQYMQKSVPGYQRKTAAEEFLKD